MELLGVPIFDDDQIKLLVRFAFNLAFVLAVIFVAYFRHQKNKGYVFTFLLLNVVVFFICFSLKKLQLELGMALGLFAIFSILRYRTDQIRVKEMTYLFVVIGLAVINALANKKTSYTELVFMNVVITALTIFLEHSFLKKDPDRVKLSSQDVVYDKLDLLHPDREEDLIRDLVQRTGLDVQRVDVKKIDLAKGSSSIVVRYSKRG